MAILNITEDEWYPVYDLVAPRDVPSKVDVIVDVPDELVDRFCAAQQEFDAVQRLLRDLRHRRLNRQRADLIQPVPDGLP